MSEYPPPDDALAEHEPHSEDEGDGSVHVGAEGDFGANIKATEEHRDVGLHHDTLFDMSEDLAGERRDLATGKPIDNSHDDSAENAALVEVPEHEGDDLLPPLELDATDAWLAANDPTHPNYKPK